MWLKTLIFTFFISFCMQSPTLAQVCKYSGTPDELLQKLNKMDELKDLKDQADKDYINCLLEQEKNDYTSLSKKEHEVLEAYSEILYRDPQFVGGAEFDEAMP